MLHCGVVQGRGGHIAGAEPEPQVDVKRAALKAG
jgi:hypothetical protein